MRRSRLAVVLALVSGGNAFAQQPPVSPPTGTISGVIISAEDLPGMPSRPSVSVINTVTGEEREVPVDGDKRFKATGLPFGTYDVEVTESCFVPLVRRYTLSADQREVTDRLTLEEWRVPIKVRNAETGEGVAGATVEIKPAEGPGRQPSEEEIATRRRRTRLWLRDKRIVTDASGAGSARACLSDGDEGNPDGSRVIAVDPSFRPYARVLDFALSELEPISSYPGPWQAPSQAKFERTPEGGFRMRLVPLESSPPGQQLPPWLRPPLVYPPNSDGALEINLVPVEPLPDAPGVIIEAEGAGEDTGALNPTSIGEETSFILDNRPAGQTSQDNLATFNNVFKADYTAGGFGVRAGVAIDLSGSAPAKSLAAGSTGASAPRARSWRPVLTVGGGISRVSHELRYDKIDDSTTGGRDTDWTGTGTVLRGDLTQSLRLRLRLSLRFGYEYQRVLGTDMARSPALQPSGGRLVADGAELSGSTHVAHARLGWSSRHLTPGAGVRLSWRKLRLAGEAAAAVQVPQGLVEQRISFVNEFEADRVLAEFGLDARIPRRPVYLRAQAATNGSDLRFAVSVSRAWFRGR
jgi:hypothetical protein